MKSLKVMPDFCSSGIWDYKTGVMVDYEDLSISEELKRAFKDWIEFYDRKCTSKKTYCILKSKEQILNKKGRELACRLKKELPKTDVYYYADYSNGHCKLEKIT